MATAKNKQPPKMTIWQAVLQRRVLQIIGIYIAVSWGIVQFVDWIVNRYVLSPHLIDLTLIILLSLLPSMLIVAYFHGRPGRDRWTRMEKITIPVNLVITAVILIVFSSGKDLGAAQKAVTFKNESGVQVQKLIPKNQFRKKVALFYFENQSGNKSWDWLQYGVTHLLDFDLTQDLFLETQSLSDPRPGSIGFYYYAMAKEAGYPLGLNIPLGFKKNLAEEMHKSHFLCGTINKIQDKWKVNTTLYKTRNASAVASHTFENTDIFSLVDELTIQLKKDLKIPARHIKEVDDLPIAEMFTKSMEACRLYVLGKNAMIFNNNWSEAEKYTLKALQKDPTFAWAYDTLSTIYLMTSQLSKWMESYGPLMKHLHKLPQRHQLFAKVGYYSTQQDVVKQFAVLKMIIQMYPQDIEAYTVLAVLYGIYNKPDDAIAIYQKMLEIDPSRHEVHKSMGLQYRTKGDQQKAMIHLEKYAEKFPDRTEPFALIGGLKEDMGKFKESNQYYEKALLLAPQDVKIQLKIARNELNLGRLERALNQYTRLLETSRSDKQKAQVYLGLIGYYQMTGQMDKALEYTQLRIQTLKKFTPPVIMIRFHIFSIDSYLQAGKEKEAWQVVANLKKTIPPPLNEQMVVGDIVILLEKGTAEEIEKLLPTIESMKKTLGEETQQLLLNLAKGKIAELRQEYSQARHYYSHQLKIKPNSTTANRQIALCHMKEKQYGDAEVLLKKINKIQPFEPGINLDLAEIYWQMGEKELALKHLKSASVVWQKADPQYAPAQRAKKRMADWQL